jgi:hypothetical protein
MFDWISAVLNPIGSLVDGWQKRKTAQLESDLAINKAVTEAKIQRLATAQEADIAWENTALSNSGWKDEWFTVVLSIPLIMCFIPGLDGYVKAGFAALSASTPEWYQWALLVAISASFGYKKLADFMALKKGV